MSCGKVGQDLPQLESVYLPLYLLPFLVYQPLGLHLAPNRV
jgi:hypothetical protein